jgi:hypothetical protein
MNQQVHLWAKVDRGRELTESWRRIDGKVSEAHRSEAQGGEVHLGGIELIRDDNFLSRRSRRLEVSTVAPGRQRSWCGIHH